MERPGTLGAAGARCFLCLAHVQGAGCECGAPSFPSSCPCVLGPPEWGRAPASLGGGSLLQPASQHSLDFQVSLGTSGPVVVKGLTWDLFEGQAEGCTEV